MILSEKLQEIKSTLVSLAAIIGVVLGAILYFAPAAELAEFRQQYYQDKRFSRMQYLDQVIMDWEYRYKCYDVDRCSAVMPPEVHKVYRDRKQEQQRLWEILNSQ